MMCQAASTKRFRALKHESGIAVVVRIIACFQPLRECQGRTIWQLCHNVITARGCSAAVSAAVRRPQPAVSAKGVLASSLTRWRCHNVITTRGCSVAVLPRPAVSAKGVLASSLTRIHVAHRTCSLASSCGESFLPLRFHAAEFSTKRGKEETTRRDLTAQDEDPFDPLTDRIPEKPVTFAEGASYSVAIFAGFAVAAAAAYAVFKELIFEPKEYKVFNKALHRIQSDNQVTVRIGQPLTGYGQDSRNRAARQRIPHRAWVDEDGVERIEVQFYVRGPHGVGRVHSEMFKDKGDKQWKFTYLIVDILSPSPTRLMLESYVPA